MLPHAQSLSSSSSSSALIASNNNRSSLRSSSSTTSIAHRQSASGSRAPIDLPSQLAQIHDAYRLIQANAAESDMRMELTPINPGIPVRKVPINKIKGSRIAMTAGELYDGKRSVVHRCRPQQTWTAVGRLHARLTCHGYRLVLSAWLSLTAQVTYASLSLSLLGAS